MEQRPAYRAFGAFRLVLALVVAVGHGAWLAPGDPVASLVRSLHAGSVAVLVFFVLSGFILAEAADTFYRGRPLALAGNRALKIVPPFWGALALSVGVHAAIGANGDLAAGLSFEGYATVPPTLWRSDNILYNGLAIVPFLRPDDVWQWIGEVYLFVRYVWAVNVEVLFYGFVFVFVGVRALSSEGRSRGVGLLLAYGGVALYVVLAGQGDLGFYFRFFPLFLLGVSLYAVRARRAWVPVAGASLCAAAVSVVIQVSGVNPLTDPAAVPDRAMAAVIVFAAAVAAIGLLAGLEVSPRLRRYDRVSGDLSYAVYLNHYIVLVLFSAAAGRVGSGTATLAAMLVVATAVAAAMYLSIERPMVSVRTRLRGARIR